MTLHSEVVCEAASKSEAFLAVDGLTYACKADRLIGRPEETLRNKEILGLRRSGYAKALVDCFIAGYDDTRYPDWGDSAQAHTEKRTRVYDDICGGDPDFPF